MPIISKEDAQQTLIWLEAEAAVRQGKVTRSSR